MKQWLLMQTLLLVPDRGYETTMHHFSDGTPYIVDTKSTSHRDDAPICVVNHGVMGHPRRHGVLRTICDVLCGRGWRCVIFYRRGYGNVKLRNLTHLPPYCDTRDFHEFTTSLCARYPCTRRMVAIGTSAGSNMLVRYLGEYADCSPYERAVSMSTAPNMYEFKRSLYKTFLARHMMVSFMRGMAKKHGLVPPDTDDVFEFTKRVMCPNEDLTQFCKNNSCDEFLDQVRVPVLFMISKDDPIVAFQLTRPIIDASKRNLNVRVVVTEHGGHGSWMVGFASSWATSQVVHFLI